MKRINGFDTYFVNEQGEVFSTIGWNGNKYYSYKEPKKLKLSPDRKGYLQFATSVEGVHKTLKIHRVVLETFVGSCPEGMEGCHLDGNPANNKLNNLKWGYASDNNMMKHEHGTAQIGKKNCCCKMSKQQALKIIELRKDGYGLRDISEMFGISQAQVSRIARAKSRKYIQAEIEDVNKDWM